MNANKYGLLFAIFSIFCSPAWAADNPVTNNAVWASYYAKRYVGRPTASGERYDPKLLTAAHPTLPLGSIAEVRRWSDGSTVAVRINDRGPARGGIDLSEAAARALGMLADGTALVVVTPSPQLAER